MARNHDAVWTFLFVHPGVSGLMSVCALVRLETTTAEEFGSMTMALLSLYSSLSIVSLLAVICNAQVAPRPGGKTTSKFSVHVSRFSFKRAFGALNDHNVDCEGLLRV